MIQPFVEWLKSTPSLPFDAAYLSDHLASQRTVILQDSSQIKTFAEVWPDSSIGDGTRIIASQLDGVWIVDAMVDVGLSRIGPFAYDRLGYVPRHVLFEWYNLNEGIQIRGMIGAVGAAKLVETYDKAAISVFNIQGHATDTVIADSIKSYPDVLGLWKFSGLEALTQRKLVGFTQPHGSPPNVWMAKAIMGQHYGLQ